VTTKIEWVKNPDGSQGYTWNPITGCLNHINGLCKGGGFPCYAYKLANGRVKSLYLANKNVTPCGHGSNDSVCVTHDDLTNPFYPRLWQERLNEDLGVYRGIFVCDMSDLFGNGVPEEWTSQVLDRIKRSSHRNRYYLLTKQPQNLAKFSPFPDNCWVGVTVCNDKMLDVAADKLEDIQAGEKFISFEPLLERLTLSLDYAFYYSGVSWCIIGACTGTKPEMSELIREYPDLTLMPYGNRWTAQPKIEWLKEIVGEADEAGIKVFLKDNLKPLIFADPLFAEGLLNWAGELRQELPQ